MTNKVQEHLDKLPPCKQQHLEKYKQLAKRVKGGIAYFKQFSPKGNISMETDIRRICLYGGPGTGKTTAASDLFAEFKRMCVEYEIDRQFELVQEFVKTWAWEGKSPKGFDQNFIFANQQQREEVPLRNGVHHIFTDSPLLLSAAYARKYHVKSWQALIQLSELHEEVYPGLHIFLERGNRPYVGKGRYEDEEKAKKMDSFLVGMLDLFIGSENYVTFPYDDLDGLTKLIAEKLDLTETWKKRQGYPETTPNPGYAGDIDNFGGSDF